MSNVKNKRTGLKFLGGNYQRFTMNKTQQNQSVYSKVQARFPGAKGRRGQNDCAGPDTKTGCRPCLGYTYTLDISLNAWSEAFPTYGGFASVNLIVDSSTNTPCEWQYNSVVEEFNIVNLSNTTVTLSIENYSRITTNNITGIYFYAPVGGSNGVYTGSYKDCGGNIINSNNPIGNRVENQFINTSSRTGAPYRNPIGGWRNSLDCSTKDCADSTSGASRQSRNTVYKDNYSGSKSNLSGCCAKDCSNATIHRKGIQGRTHHPIIRSGMQEKKPCQTSSGKCDDYSFSYRQYNHNSRYLSYDRSLEKNVGEYPCKNSDGKCLNKFSKSSCSIDCTNKSNTVTIYKPNNKKFSKQGAVSSGSRLDRLKLDTIRSSNSKCIKGKRCKIIPSKFIDGGSYKVPNGKYDAGNPRFTGWMFNGHHGEVKSRVYNMVRYNQQPLGIPQLTAHPTGKSCIKECFSRTLDSDRSTAAGNRARIPGSKCDDKCAKCPNCTNLNNATGKQGLPCCN